MSEQESRVDELADRIHDVSYLGKQVSPGAAHAIARVLLAAGYEKRPDHVAEANALRKQVEG
jgi:hypothetical protein